MAETIPPPHDDDRFLLGDLPGWYASSDDVNLRVAIRLLAEERRLREQAEAALLARNIEIDALWKGDDDKHCADMASSEQCTERYMLMRQRAEQAEARVKELEAEREWQPISTAPKDGTLIILFVPGLQGVCPGRWLCNADEGWWSSYGRTANPTHWMPLPTAPKEDTDGR